MANNTQDKQNMQKFIMLIGIPGSGKTAWAKEYVKEKEFEENLNVVVHSSDSIREELGDINDQSNNTLVFQILHERVQNDLKNGKTVIYDATNLNRKRRVSFLKEIKNINCEKICVLFAVPFEICCARNFSRERSVPEEVMSRMYKNFQTPWYSEGFDDIWIEWNYKEDGNIKFYDSYRDLIKLCGIPHDNPHHKLTIGDHMYKTFKLVDKSQSNLVRNAALLHDIGKYDCKTFEEQNPTIAHYYNHENVGAYLSLFYSREVCYSNQDVLYTSLLINLHMRPLLAYKKSKKAEEKDRKLFGDKIIDDVLIIHNADINAD